MYFVLFCFVLRDPGLPAVTQREYVATDLVSSTCFFRSKVMKRFTRVQMAFGYELKTAT